MTTTEIDGLTPDDRLNLLRQWNDQSWPAPRRRCPEAFAQQARLTPEALAVVAGDTRLTYRELAGARPTNWRTTSVPRGVGHEQMVAIALPRSAEMVVAVVAILAAGGAFVPVDPQWPAERRRQVLAETKATAVLVAPGRAGPDDPDPIESNSAALGLRRAVDRARRRWTSTAARWRTSSSPRDRPASPRAR